MSIATPRFQEAQFAYQRGDLVLAIRMCESLLRLDPANSSTLTLLGMSLARSGRLQEGVARLQEAVRRDPGSFDARIALSTMLSRQGFEEEAIEHGERAIEILPNEPGGYNHLGLLMANRGRFEEALGYFTRAHELVPNDLPSIQNCAAALRDLDRDEESVATWEEALRIAPESADLWLQLARQHLQKSRPELALAAAQRAVQFNRTSAEARLLLALSLKEAGSHGEAEKSLTKAIAFRPGDGITRATLGFWQQENGKFEEAKANLEQAIDLAPHHGFAYYNLVRSEKTTEADLPRLERIQQLAAEKGIAADDVGYFHYAAGKMLEDLGRYEEAIQAFDTANGEAYRVWLSQNPWDREEYAAGFTRTIQEFPSFEPKKGNPSELPVFIVGMIRSGTTLVEQIVSSHPDVAAGGELPFWHRHEEQVRSASGSVDLAALKRIGEKYLTELQELGSGTARVTDKLPHNYALLGLIHQAFPKARIIHLKRNAVDNCLSVYTTPYQRPPSFAHDRGNIVFAYQEYLRIMAHWKNVIPSENLLEVTYEDLVADREGKSREIVDFLGLKWDEACMRHETNERSVRTPSLWQVRQPVYRTSVERWRRFEPWLGEFRSVLA